MNVGVCRCGARVLIAHRTPPYSGVGSSIAASRARELGGMPMTIVISASTSSPRRLGGRRSKRRRLRKPILVEFGNPLVSSFSFMTYSRSCRGSIHADGLAAQRLALDLELMQDVARRKSARLLQQRSAAGEIHRSQILASGHNDPCWSPPSEGSADQKSYHAGPTVV